MAFTLPVFVASLAVLGVAAALGVTLVRKAESRLPRVVLLEARDRHPSTGPH